MKYDLEGAFRGRSVFLTGHTGFKGSWLAIWLHRLGADVTGFALQPPTQPSNFAVSRVETLLAKHWEADIRDAATLHQAVAEARPDVLFHLAAQPLVRVSYQNPAETWATNVGGTTNLLEAVRRAARPCVVVVISSDKCYENREQVWGYRECDAMGGHDPYSASKGATELLVASYRHSFFAPERIAAHGVRLATARAGNVIGGGDWAQERIVVDAVRALAEGVPLRVRNPHAVRPWQHVLEPLSGYLALAARLCEPDSAPFCCGWNFGPRCADEERVAQLVERLCRAWGKGTWCDASDPTQPREATVLRLSIDKALAELLWQPRWCLDDAVRHTVSWYQRFYRSDGDMLAACREDIEAYESRICNQAI